MILRYVLSGLFLGVFLLLARESEAATYTAIQQSVEAGTHAQTIRDARAFLQRMPQSAERAQVAFWLSEALYATQAYEDAATAYRELLEQAPLVPQAAMALYHLGLSEMHLRRYNAALETFGRLLEQFPGFQERDRVVFHRATVYVKQGRFEEALPLYQQLMRAQTLPVSLAALHLQLGQTHFYLQQFEAAQQYYHLILEGFPTSPEAPQAHYQLGAVALVQQQFEVARRYFQAMLQTYPPGAATVRAHYGLAWTWYYQGQIKRAVAYLKQQNLLAQPSATDVVLARGYDLVRLRAYHKAIPLLVRALPHAHHEAQEQRLRWLLVEAYEGIGETARALDVLDAFVRRFPTSVHVTAARTWRGKLLQQRHDPSATLVAYRAALVTAGDEEMAERLLLNMANLYQAQHAVDDAIATWQGLLQAYPLTPRRLEIQRYIGAAWVQQGAIPQAIRLYRHLLTKDLPLSIRARIELQLAWAYLKGDASDKALALYGELAQKPLESDVRRQALYWRGWMLQRQEQYEAANAEWTALLPLYPSGPRRGEVLWRLGRNLMALEQYAEARDYLLEVVTRYAMEPYARLATWQLQRCLLALNQYQEALQEAPGFVRQEPLAYVNVADRFTHGKRLFDAKQYRQARRIFQRIVTQPFVSPLTDDAAFMIAESYFVKGDQRRALAYYRMVTQRYGQTNVTALASYREGLILKEAESLAAAAGALHRAVQQATEADIRDRARYHLGDVYMQLDQPDKAVAVFRRLLQEGSATFGSEAERLRLGIRLQQLADYTMALRVFQQIARQATEPRMQAEAYFWAAETHQLGGETAAALVAYRRVAEAFPEQQDWALTALFRVGEIYETLQQYQDALRMYQRIVTANPHDRQGQFAAERVKYLKAKMAKTPAQEG